MENEENFGNLNEANLSNYNESQFTVYRIHLIKLQFNSILPSGDLQKLKWQLDQWFLEMSRDIFRVYGKDKLIEFQAELDKRFNEAKGNAELFKAIKRNHMELNIMQDLVGLGTKTRGAADYEMD